MRDALSRRVFLRAGATSALAAWAACRLGSNGCQRSAAWGPCPDGLLFGANDAADGTHHVSAFRLQSGLIFRTPLPERGHAAALHPQRPHLAVVARRPGRGLFILDQRTGKKLHSINCGAGRHHTGHAAYDAQGQRLFVPQNVFDTRAIPDVTPRQSEIAVYDAQNGYRFLGEIPAGGVGTHEVRLMAEGTTLAVANGGLYTHPSYGRAVLNRNTMNSTLTFVDIASGATLSEHRVSDQLASIRHLACGDAGAVAVAIQYQGRADTVVPLVGLYRPGLGINTFVAPGAVYERLQRYIASVAVNTAGGCVAATSPKGGCAAFWQLSGAYLGAVQVADVSGLASLGNAFVLTAGDGSVHVLDAQSLVRHKSHTVPDTRWDNHATIMPLALG